MQQACNVRQLWQQTRLSWLAAAGMTQSLLHPVQAALKAELHAILLFSAAHIQAVHKALTAAEVSAELGQRVATLEAGCSGASRWLTVDDGEEGEMIKPMTVDS